MADYNLYLTTDTGVRIPTSVDGTLATLNTATYFEASRVVTGVGSLYLELPRTFDIDLLKRDRMVQVWRAPRGGRMSLFRPYFIRRWRFSNRNGRDLIEVWGFDPNYLLTARIIANYSGESDVTSFSSEYADDIMKTLVTDSQSDALSPASTAGTRDWDNFSVAGDLSDGPQLTLDRSWKSLLKMSGGGALPYISGASKVAGTEVFFDVAVSDVSTTSISFEFRTYTGQPGSDISSGSNRVLFDIRSGSLREPYLEYDYTDEISYVYAAGQGENDDRNVQQVSDSGRYLASAWNRREAFADARTQELDDAVREAGRAVLDAGQGKERFGGDLVDTEFTRFGLDWKWGDKVAAKYQNREFTPIIRVAVLKVENGRETIKARADTDD